MGDQRPNAFVSQAEGGYIGKGFGGLTLDVKHRAIRARNNHVRYNGSAPPEMAAGEPLTGGGRTPLRLRSLGLVGSARRYLAKRLDGCFARKQKPPDASKGIL